MNKKILCFILMILTLFVTSVAMGQVIDPDQQGNGQSNSSTVTNPQVNFEQPFYVAGNTVSWQRFNFAEAMATGKYRDGRFRNLDGSENRQAKYLAKVANGTAKKVELSFAAVINMWHGGAASNRKETLVPEGAFVFVHPVPIRTERYYRPVPGDPSRVYVEEWNWYRYMAHEWCGNHGEGIVVNVARIPVTLLSRTEMRVEYKERIVYVDRPVIQTVTVPGPATHDQELIWTPVNSRNQVQTSGVTRLVTSYGGCWAVGGGSSTPGNPLEICKGPNPITLDPPANLPPLTGPNAIQNAGLDPALGGGGIGGGTGAGNGGTPITIPPPTSGELFASFVSPFTGYLTLGQSAGGFSLPKVSVTRGEGCTSLALEA